MQSVQPRLLSKTKFTDVQARGGKRRLHNLFPKRQPKGSDYSPLVHRLNCGVTSLGRNPEDSTNEVGPTPQPRRKLFSSEWEIDLLVM
jgi:hypothetical protein